jgi:hypothetical protein
MSFESSKPLKAVMVVGCEASNSYLLLDKEIRQYITNDQNILHLPESDQISHKL